MSRILFLAPTLPWPQDSGSRIRTAQLLHGLRDRHEVTLWCVERPGSTSSDLEHTRERCAELRMFPRSSSPWLQRMSSPLESSWFHSKSLSVALRELDKRSFGLMHLDELAMAAMLPKQELPPVVQHHHKLDLELCRELRPQGPRRQLELDRWARLEREGLGRGNHQIFCSHEDAKLFSARHPDAHSSIVPNGVDCEAFQPAGQEREMDHLLWLGSTDYEPNLRGLRRFLHELWPRLRSARPNLRLSIVGRGHAQEGLELPAGVRWIGAVPDVRPWLARACALVVPLDIGGGTRLKILEAAAAGCPIVTTRVGVEGLRFEQGKHLLIAEDLAGLVQPLMRCLMRWNEAQSRADAARGLVEREYHWPVLADQLAQVWQGLAAD